jgi:hypothetical protein
MYSVKDVDGLGAFALMVEKDKNLVVFSRTGCSQYISKEEVKNLYKKLGQMIEELEIDGIQNNKGTVRLLRDCKKGEIIKVDTRPFVGE